jgi:hypothetical protein
MMTQALKMTDSPGRALRASRRHLRLAKRTGNAQAMELAGRVRVPMDTLTTAVQTQKAAHEATEDAFDDWDQSDQLLDRTVKSSSRKATDWDEDHPGSRTHATLFAGATASSVVATTREKEPDVVEAIVTRGAGLPEGHPSLPLLPALTELANASRANYKTWADASKREAAAATATEAARLDLIRVYRDNQIDIERACGSAIAEACFPRLRSGSRADEADIEEPLPSPPGPSTPTPS